MVHVLLVSKSEQRTCVLAEIWLSLDEPYYEHKEEKKNHMAWMIRG
jgi:hypothetical protein